MVKCPECHGEGSFHQGGPYLPPGGFWEDCDLCNGTGIVSQILRMDWVRSHKKVKEKGPLRWALDKALELVKK